MQQKRRGLMGWVVDISNLPIAQQRGLAMLGVATLLVLMGIASLFTPRAPVAAGDDTTPDYFATVANPPVSTQTPTPAPPLALGSLKVADYHVQAGDVLVSWLRATDGQDRIASFTILATSPEARTYLLYLLPVDAKGAGTDTWKSDTLATLFEAKDFAPLEPGTVTMACTPQDCSIGIGPP